MILFTRQIKKSLTVNTFRLQTSAKDIYFIFWVQKSLIEEYFSRECIEPNYQN